MRKTSKTNYKTCRKCHTSHASHVVSVFIVQLTISALVISFIALFSNNSSNNISALSYQNTQDILFTFNPVVTIGISGELSINDLAPGSSSDSNIITIVAGTNDDNGYTLYTNVGSSTNNYTDLRISSSDDDNVFSTLSTPVPSLNSFENNKWGYSYCNATNNVNDCTNNNNWVYGSSTTGSTSTTTGYGILPLYNDSTHSNDIVLADTVTASETTLQFKIGAKASSTQASGVYTNTINFIGVPKVITTNYTINYHGNNATSGVPTQQTGSTTNAYVTLSDSKPVKEGYTFKGWCNVDNTSNTATCPNNGTITQVGNIYALNTTNTSITADLYAIWSPAFTFDEAFAAAGKTKYNGYYKMQDMTTDICDSIETNQTGSLIDIRGSTEIYTVAKLKDSKCWMTENLNIAGGTALSVDDTDIAGSYISDFVTSNNLVKSGNTLVIPTSSSTGFSQDHYSYVYNSGNKTNCGGSSQSIPCYSYYSWDVATLGSGRTIAEENIDAPYSICPKNWKLPTSGSTEDNGWKRGDFYQLATSYGVDLEDASNRYPTTFYDDAGQNTVPNLLLAGYYDGDTFQIGDPSGYYWSSTSTPFNSPHARAFYINTVYINSASYYRLRLGFAIRCLTK